LSGKQIIVYQHSAVGRDILVDLLKSFGAEVVPVDRSDVFVSIDTENITPDNAAYFKQLAENYPDNFAIVSTDGDSDRPFVVDETGKFHRGDLLGAVVAEHLGADTFLHVDAGPCGMMTVRAEGEYDATPDAKIFLTPEPSRIHRFDKDGKAIRK